MFQPTASPSFTYSYATYALAPCPVHFSLVYTRRTPRSRTPLVTSPAHSEHHPKDHPPFLWLIPRVLTLLSFSPPISGAIRIISGAHIFLHPSFLTPKPGEVLRHVRFYPRQTPRRMGQIARRCPRNVENPASGAAAHTPLSREVWLGLES